MEPTVEWLIIKYPFLHGIFNWLWWQGYYGGKAEADATDNDDDKKNDNKTD